MPIKHGHTRQNGLCSPTYQSWVAMKHRCASPNTSRWQHYGGRGIRVCARWMSFENFLEDMDERPPGTTLDRINNDGDYEPGNCRWATNKEQAYNSSRAHFVVIDGEKYNIEEAAAKLGILRRQIYRRVSKHKITHQDAVDFYIAKNLFTRACKCSSCSADFVASTKQQFDRFQRGQIVVCSIVCRNRINRTRKDLHI